LSDEDLVGSMTDFVFLADALALDFVNTEVVVRGKRRDLLEDSQAFVEWWQAAKEHHQSTRSIEKPDEASLGNAKLLRAGLRRLFTAVSNSETPSPDDTSLLNAVLKTGHYVLEADLTGIYRSDDGENALLTLALSAFHLLTKHDLSRIHHCKNERCILLFYDTSKNSTRRWCSWDCMNRARSIANYRERKK
jgi:predicted RNA-binding Zn ribbon-like protein